MPKDFTPRTFTADELRGRWAHHLACQIAWTLVSFATTVAGAVLGLAYGHHWVGGALFLASVLVADPFVFYHLGAARTITKISFGDRP